MKPISQLFSIALGVGLSAGAIRAAEQVSPLFQYAQSPYSKNADEFSYQSSPYWPAAEAREPAFARARAVIAKYEAIRARDRLNEQIDRLTRQFESSPDYLAARQAEEQAWAGFQSAMASVLARLSSDVEYRANSTLAADIGQQIKDRAWDAENDAVARTVISPEILDLATAKLSYATRASILRAEAVAGDPAIAEARAKLSTAAAKVRELRLAFDNKVRDDATVLALREANEQAKIVHLAAAAYEDSVKTIRRQALLWSTLLLDQSVFNNTYDSGYYRSPYYYYGSSYGSPTPLIHRTGYTFRRR